MSIKNILLMLSVLSVSYLSVSTAFADLAAMKARVPALVKAKEAGLVGEQADGLVGVISEAKGNTSVESLIAEENEDRMEVYRNRASQQDQELGVFMKVMGEARTEGEKKGRFIQGADGSWKKK